ncbi:MAG: ATP-binding protein [Hespellia sp.]|nr:ATP-binding protein [Hespellia sp.]
MDVKIGIYAVIYYIVEFVKIYLLAYVILRCTTRKLSLVAGTLITGCLICVGMNMSMNIGSALGTWKGFLVLFSAIVILKKIKQVPIIVACYFAISLVDLLVGSMVSYLLDTDIKTLALEPIVMQGINNISLILLLAVAFAVFYAKNYKNKKEELEFTDSILTKIAGVAAILLFVGCYMVVIERSILLSDHKSLLELLGACGIGILVLVFSGIYISSVHQQAQNEIRIQYYADMLNKEKNYYKKLKKTDEDTKKLRHDMKSHLGIVQALVKNGEISRAEKYLENLNTRFNSKLISFTGNSFADIAISDVLDQFEGIVIKCKGILPEEIRMDDIDTGILFSNLILNAAEALVKAEQKQIVLEIECMGTMLMIREKNAYSGKIKIVDGKPVTSKQDKMLHGYGIKSMTDVVQRYNGEIQFHVDNQLFTVEIMLENVI